MCACACMHMEVRGQLMGASFFLPPHGSRGSNSGCQCRQQAHLFSKPSSWYWTYVYCLDCTLFSDFLCYLIFSLFFCILVSFLLPNVLWTWFWLRGNGLGLSLFCTGPMGSSGWSVPDSLVEGHSPEVVAPDQREGMLSILKATSRLVLRMVGQAACLQAALSPFPCFFGPSGADVPLVLLMLPWVKAYGNDSLNFLSDSD